MRVFADVVIVGAGVIGCSAAYYLSRTRGTRVIVVEKGSLVSGMTKRCGGLIRSYYPLEAEARLALSSLHTFQNWKDAIGGSCGFTQTGFAIVADEGPAAESLRGNVDWLREIGANATLISPKELQELEPAARTDDVAVAAYEPEAGYADAVTTTQSLAARAKAMGVTFQTGTFAKSILVQRGRVFGVDTNIGEIQTLKVVVAAGPWSDRLLKPLGIEIGIRPELTQIAFFERPPEIKAGHPAFLDLATGAYFRPHTYGLTQAGLNVSDALSSPNPDHFEETLSPQFVADVRQRMATRVPALSQARYVRGHTGIYDMAPDGHAVIDNAPGIHGLVVAAGFSGTGFGLAPAAGQCIMELVTEGVSSSVKLESLSFARLSNHQN